MRLNRLIRYKVPCRVLLIMREEFIGHLSEFEPLCPSLFQHRFRVEKMRKESVKEVIRKTLDVPQYRDAFRVDGSEQLAGRILALLPDKSREIELAHVQVFLSELWERAAETGDGAAMPALHEGLVRDDDNLAGVLDSFLKKQLRELDTAYGENTALETLAAMISERHTKLQLTPEDLLRELTDNGIVLKVPLQDLLRELEGRRILRSLRSGGQIQYEISHDVLAQVVGKNLTEEMQLREKAREVYRVYEGREGLLSREDMDYLRPFGNYLPLPEELKQRMQESEEVLERRQREELEQAQRQAEQERVLREKAERSEQRAQQRFLFALIASIIAVGFLLAAGYFYWDAERQKRDLEKANTEIEAKREEAETAKQIALDRQAEAEAARDSIKNVYQRFVDEQLRREQAELGQAVAREKARLAEIFTRLDGLPSAEIQRGINELRGYLSTNEFPNNRDEINRKIGELQKKKQ